MTSAEIKALRKRLGLSQAGLGKKLGVSTNTVGLWELGRVHPRGDNLDHLLNLSGKNPGALLVDTFSKPLPLVESASKQKAALPGHAAQGAALKLLADPPAATDAPDGVMRGSFALLLEALDGIKRAINVLGNKLDGAEALEGRLRLLEREIDRIKGAR